MSVLSRALRLRALSAAAAVVLASSALAAEAAACAARPSGDGGAQRRFQEACASLERGALPAALVGFDAALSLDSRFLDAYAHRAVVLSLQGQGAKASVDYSESRKALGHERASEPACPCGAVAARELRRLSEAARRGQEAKASGIALFLKGDKAGARRKLDSALSVDPGDPESYQSRAVVREASGDWRGALDDYEKGLEFSARRSDFQKSILASRAELRDKWRAAILADEAAKDAAAAKPAALRDAVMGVFSRALPFDFAAHGWRILAALGLLLAVRASRPLSVPAPDRRPWLLFLGALALRCVFGLWGPYHHNGHGTEWVWDALQVWGDPRFYGPGYYEVLRPFAALWPRAPDFAVFAANAVASALIPVFVYGIARQLFDDRERPWMAGLLMLADPISVRYAASEAYLIPISALTAAAALLLMKAAVIPEGACPSGRGTALAVSGGLLAAQAARIHPVAWIPVGLSLAAAICAWKARGVRSRGTALLAAAALAALLVAALPTIMASFVRIIQPRSPEQVPLPFVIFTYDHWWIGLLAVAGAGVALARTVGLADPALPLCLAAAAAIVGTRDVFVMSPLFTAGYDRLFLPFLLPGLSLLLCRWPRAARAPLAVAALAVVLLLSPYVPAVFQRNTEQLEYRTTRAWLAELPADCRFVVPQSFTGPNISIPDFVAKDVGRGRSPHRKVRTRAELAALLGERHACAYYLRTSLCSLRESGDVCEEIERLPGLREAARATLPARSSTRCWDYAGPTVDIVLFRLPGPGQDRPEAHATRL